MKLRGHLIFMKSLDQGIELSSCRYQGCNVLICYHKILCADFLKYQSCKFIAQRVFFTSVLFLFLKVLLKWFEALDCGTVQTLIKIPMFLVHPTSLSLADFVINNPKLLQVLSKTTISDFLHPLYSGFKIQSLGNCQSCIVSFHPADPNAKANK